MGSSKKHKIRESKKKKHRSRSHTPERPKEKHRHHKRHHKERKKEKLLKEKNGEYLSKYVDYESDDDVVAVPPPPKISRPSPPPPPLISTSSASASTAVAPPPPPLSPPAASRSDRSLSIEETNKLRARLGLKPLRVEEIPALSADDEEKKKEREASGATMGGTDMGEFVHKPALNIKEKVQTERIKQKLHEHREKRHIETKLARVKPLAESDSDDDTRAWVERNRKLQMEREKAAKQAKMLEELDAEFGVGELVEDEIRAERKDAYSSRDLRGLRVEHDVERFTEGKTVVLTLKDHAVLDEDDDVLVNVNMIDEERYERSNFNKKAKALLHGYDVYDDQEMNAFGEYKKRDILSKYDEEIGGKKKKSFALGDDVVVERQKQVMDAVRSRLSKKRVESLLTPAAQIASDYYTQEEMEVKFKKPKKKVRKIRKKLKVEDLVPDASASTWDYGSRSHRRGETVVPEEIVIDGPDGDPVRIKSEPDDEPMDISPPPPIEDLADVKIEPDDTELQLQLALKKARKLKQLEKQETKASVEKVAKTILEEKKEGIGTEAGGSIILNATAEFCRTLGDIPTYGLSGNRDEDAEELLDFERELNEEKRRQEEEGRRGAWNEVEIDETPVDVLPAEVPILDAEPDVGTGVAGALRLALSKGYLERETMNKPSASRFAHLQAQNYSIEDKTHIDDDKFGRRERYNGPTSDFKEKDNYKPNVKLDYIDDDGRVLNAKEAFRYLSHKFHGKGPGKNKVEKRMKKNEQEGLMKQMSSTDTPLGTLNLLQQKQKETQSAFVVLSGSKQATLISKTKL
ncbi:U4/U6.U5 tri-snRNP-associated protein 1 [Anabrus simplex]|uniref:U4/U6.U5 tri-snRNP-associated protein 1 n=1 Tax=Anabrus simplex TaxID=316456 RepID=UPI0035A32F0F